MRSHSYVMCIGLNCGITIKRFIYLESVFVTGFKENHSLTIESMRLNWTITHTHTCERRIKLLFYKTLFLFFFFCFVLFLQHFYNARKYTMKSTKKKLLENIAPIKSIIISIKHSRSDCSTRVLCFSFTATNTHTIFFGEENKYFVSFSMLCAWEFTRTLLHVLFMTKWVESCSIRKPFFSSLGKMNAPLVLFVMKITS